MPTENEWTCEICDTQYEGRDEFSGLLSDGGMFCIDCQDSVDICTDCDEVFIEGDDRLYSVGDRLVCNECYGEYTECYDCEDVVSDPHFHDGIGEYFCYDCYSSRLVTCDMCDDEVEQLHQYRDSTGCQPCVSRICEREMQEAASCTAGHGCEEHTNDLRESLAAAVRLNAFGIGERMWRCTSCDGLRRRQLPGGTPHDIADTLIHARFTNAVCGNCVTGPGTIRTSYIVNSYSYKPNPNFKKTSRDFEVRALHFGTEVEIEMADGISRDTALRRLTDADEERLFYCKSDASVSTGFELVTHPFTFDWMKENPKSFNVMFDLADIMRGYSSIRCGMHVHMSADAFSNLQLYKFMRFFYTNPSFIRVMSRRPKGRFDRWAHLAKVSKKQAMKYALNKGAGIGAGRGALSFEPANTIECRIFRSTLSPTAYYGNVEFLQALFDYTKNCGAGDDELTPPKLLSFARARSKAYNNLVTLVDMLPPAVQDEMEV